MDDGSVVMLAGFSERLLDFVTRYEADKTDALKAIKSVKPEAVRVPKRWFSDDTAPVVAEHSEA